MTAYVANHEKKKRIFEKRERELLHAIKHDAPMDRLLIAAEKVRAAKVSVYKCRFAQNSERQPQSFSADELAEGNKDLRLWLSMSSDEIIALYRPKEPPASRMAGSEAIMDSVDYLPERLGIGDSDSRS